MSVSWSLVLAPRASVAVISSTMDAVAPMATVGSSTVASRLVAELMTTGGPLSCDHSTLTVSPSGSVAWPASCTVVFSTAARSLPASAVGGLFVGGGGGGGLFVGGGGGWLLLLEEEPPQALKTKLAVMIADTTVSCLSIPSLPLRGVRSVDGLHNVQSCVVDRDSPNA